MRPQADAHPASRLLLVYAACLAAMLVLALAVATYRNAPSAEAESGRSGAPATATGTAIKATVR